MISSSSHKDDFIFYPTSALLALPGAQQGGDVSMTKNPSGSFFSLPSDHLKKPHPRPHAVAIHALR
jgi:hypothetical protein